MIYLDHMKKLSKTEWIAVGVSMLFVVYTLFGGNITALFQSVEQGNTLATATQNTSGSGVIVNDVIVGNGAVIERGQLVSVHYTLTLSDGTLVQNSRDVGLPIKFVLGDHSILPSFEDGLIGTKVGSVRTIVIPSELGYGPNQNGPIPANSTLIFTVEVLDAVPMSPQAI